MKTVSKNILRKRRHARIRARVVGDSARPRLTIFKSNRFVSAQVIDDTTGRTLISAHGREFKGSQAVQAVKVGQTIALRAKEAGVTSVVFDRGGYQYTA